MTENYYVCIKQIYYTICVNYIIISGYKKKEYIFFSFSHRRNIKRAKSKKDNEIWTFFNFVRNVQKRKSENSFDNDFFFKGFIY